MDKSPPIEQHKDWSPPKVDKRTKTYREYRDNFIEKHANDSKGFGDTLEKILEATKVKNAVEWIGGKDCGCKERKEKANKVFSYKIIQCPTEDMYNYLKEYFSTPQRTDITGPQQTEFNRILTHVFQRKFKRLGCCYGDRLNLLKKLYQEYQ